MGLGAWFWKYVDKTKGCWLWTGPLANYQDGRDYGRVQRSGVRRLAHVLSYEAEFGTVPRGKLVLHRCDVSRCVRPSHLFVGTQHDNVRDMVGKRRHARGAMHGRAKLDDSDVVSIRARREAGESFVVLAERFGVSESTVRHIVSGRRWGRVLYS